MESAVKFTMFCWCCKICAFWTLTFWLNRLHCVGLTLPRISPMAEALDVLLVSTVRVPFALCGACTVYHLIHSNHCEIQGSSSLTLPLRSMLNGEWQMTIHPWIACKECHLLSGAQGFLRNLRWIIDPGPKLSFISPKKAIFRRVPPRPTERELTITMVNHLEVVGWSSK